MSVLVALAMMASPTAAILTIPREKMEELAALQAGCQCLAALGVDIDIPKDFAFTVLDEPSLACMAEEAPTSTGKRVFCYIGGTSSAALYAEGKPRKWARFDPSERRHDNSQGWIFDGR